MFIGMRHPRLGLAEERKPHTHDPVAIERMERRGELLDRGFLAIGQP